MTSSSTRQATMEVNFCIQAARMQCVQTSKCHAMEKSWLYIDRVIESASRERALNNSRVNDTQGNKIFVYIL